MNQLLKSRLNTFKALYDENFSMTKATFDEYIEVAVRFIDSFQGHTAESLETLERDAVQKLQNIESKTRTGDGWRKLRRALVVFFEALKHNDIAQRIDSIQNPTVPEERPHKPGRNRRLSTVYDDDFELMSQKLIKENKWTAHACCVVTQALGLRPCELAKINYWTDRKLIYVDIPASKATKKGKADPKFQRGIDREIIVPFSAELEDALRRCNDMEARWLGRIQNTIRDASQSLWPRRKTNFCLYSLRYTLGSNMKAALAKDPGGAIKIAAVLGHKSTSSARSYGNIRSGTGGFTMPVATAETIERVNDDRAVSRERWKRKQAAAQQEKQAPSSDPSF